MTTLGLTDGPAQLDAVRTSVGLVKLAIDGDAEAFMSLCEGTDDPWTVLFTTSQLCAEVAKLNVDDPSISYLTKLGDGFDPRATALVRFSLDGDWRGAVGVCAGMRDPWTVVLHVSRMTGQAIVDNVGPEDASRCVGQMATAILAAAPPSVAKKRPGPPVGPHQKRRAMTCEECGKSFLAGNSLAKTCSSTCRQSYVRRRG